jgi:hypothetical protein
MTCPESSFRSRRQLGRLRIARARRGIGQYCSTLGCCRKRLVPRAFVDYVGTPRHHERLAPCHSCGLSPLFSATQRSPLCQMESATNRTACRASRDFEKCQNERVTNSASTAATHSASAAQNFALAVSDIVHTPAVYSQHLCRDPARPRRG